jgi:hypothetical protein
MQQRMALIDLHLAPCLQCGETSQHHVKQARRAVRETMRRLKR